MADSEKVSSLPLDRERFEAHYSYGDDETLNSTGWTIKQVRWEAWQAASAGRQELLEALRKFRQATNTLQVAQQDGINVHGALSAFLGARDMADAAIAKALGEQP